MKSIKLTLLIAIAFLGLNNASAQDSDNPWMLTFGANFVDVASAGLMDPIDTATDFVGLPDWNVIPAVSRVSVSRYLNKGFSLELAGAINKISMIPEGDVDDLSYFSLDLAAKYDLNHLKFIGETGWFDPYLQLGVGNTWIDNSNGLTINPGFGFNVWFNDNIGITYSALYKSSAFTGGELTGVATDVHFQHAIGLSIKFGGTDTDGDGIYDKKDACIDVPGLEEFNGCPDTDADGVVDSDDACPNTPGLAKLNGCPDSDGDGVADKNDKCPNAKGTAKNNGCPDSDGDGVVDAKDKCKDVAGPKANNGCPWKDTDADNVLDKDDACPTEAGPASNNGCPEGLSAEALKVLENFNKSMKFNIGTTKYRKGADKEIDAVAEVIKEYSRYNFVLTGHCDITGSKSFNDKLSVDRALLIKKSFIDRGIDESRLSTVGFGFDKPIASNKTRAGRAENRRVEITVAE